MPRRRASEDEWEEERMLGGQQRNAANARERARMRVLSRAFCRLKTTLPWVPADTKLSKLDTLRLATSYIAHLRALLCLDQDHNDEQTTVHPLNLTWPFSFQQSPGTVGNPQTGQNEVSSSWNENHNTSLSSSSSPPSSRRLEDCTDTVMLNGDNEANRNDQITNYKNKSSLQYDRQRSVMHDELHYNSNDHSHNLTDRIHLYYNSNHAPNYSDSILQIG